MVHRVTKCVKYENLKNNLLTMVLGLYVYEKGKSRLFLQNLLFLAQGTIFWILKKGPVLLDNYPERGPYCQFIRYLVENGQDDVSYVWPHDYVGKIMKRTDFAHF